MNEVVIPLKISGIAGLKAELKDLKDQMADAANPEAFAELADKAGDVQKQINKVNNSINDFKKGSNLDQAKASIEGIGTSIMALDFTSATKQSANLKQTLGALKPKDLTKGFTGFISTIKNLGGAFVKLGITILMNPIFMLVAVIVSIVAAVALFLDKIGVLQVALGYLMIPINAAIAALKRLGDWLGITNYAAADAASQRKKEGEAASKRSDTAINETNALMAAKAKAAAKEQESFSIADEAKGREIALMKAQGKDTTDLQRTRLKASIAFQNALAVETVALTKQIREKNKLTLAELYATGERVGDFSAYNKLLGEQDKAINDNNKTIIAANKAYLDGINELAIFEQEIINDKKKANADKVKSSKDTNKIVIDHEANALELKRKLKDQELADMKDGIAKELAMIVEKYDRQAEDLIKNTKYSAKEKQKLQKFYDAQETKERDAKQEANRILVEKNAKESEVGLIALRLEAMVEGEAKELAQQADKYKKLRDAALADTKLTAEQLQEKLDIYNALEIAEDAKRAKAKSDAASALYFEITATEDQKKIAALNEKYAKEQELAKGNQVLLQELQTQHETALTRIEKDASIKRIEEAAAERDAKLTLANDITKGITDIGGMLIKDQEKLAKFNKASALVQIGIDTAKAISALVAASNANPLNAVSAGTAGIAQFAAGIIQIATNIAKAKQLLTAPSASVSGGGGGGSSASAGGGGSNTATMIPQTAQLFGQGNNANTVNASGTSTETGGNMTVTAIVSETQITNVQKKINMINKNAEL
jgi:hypothetical protein